MEHEPDEMRQRYGLCSHGQTTHCTVRRPQAQPQRGRRFGPIQSMAPLTRRTPLMPKVSLTSMLLALNVAIFGLMLAWRMDPMQRAIARLITWGADYGAKTPQGDWWRMFACR